MSIRHVLITGGAGFIGSHLGNELIASGYRVRALDNLSPQVHGESRARPGYLHPDVELVVGDVRDPAAVARSLEDVDAVFHLAAAVGVGQSMYEIERYTSVNNGGTAVLMEHLARKPVAKLVVASSMSVYGEGLFHDTNGNACEARPRTLEQLRRGDWEPRGGNDGRLVPVPTSESKTVALESVYALSKYDQERMCRIVGRAYGIPTVALRFFNAYGRHQALSNPYTGVLAIFGARILNRQAPLLFEDGQQRRDFVSVLDVARACRQALESDAQDEVLNIGSGESHTVLEVAREMAAAMNAEAIVPEITGRYRMGDIRHCFADVSQAKKKIGYTPAVSFVDGLADSARWLRDQSASDRTTEARAELDARGLTL